MSISDLFLVCLAAAAACGGAPRLAVAGDAPTAWTSPTAWASPSRSTEHSWTGLYVGGHSGLAVLDEARREPGLGLRLPANPLATGILPSLPALPLATAPVIGPHQARAAATFGVQAGYNHQLDPGSGVVLGIETDISGRSSFPKP